MLTAEMSHPQFRIYGECCHRATMSITIIRCRLVCMLYIMD